MSLLSVKAGDWIKVQVTRIDLDSKYPIKCDGIEFTLEGRYTEWGDKIAFPLEPTERWMMVSDDNIKWYKRKVFNQKNGYFLTWSCAKTDEEIDYEHVTSWKLAKEIEEVSPVELTLEEIAEKFGVNVNQIKIKK
jgi:hypothetical protein